MLASSAAVFLLSLISWADLPKPAAAEIGATAPDFRLKDIHRRARTLEDFQGKKALVIVFFDTECPVANLYLPTLADLHKEYSGKGVGFVGINSSVQDSFARVSAHAQEHNVPFPVLKDFEHRTALAFGAERTPEAIVLDGSRVIRYRGRIDNQYAVGTRRDKPTETYLKDAIEAILASKAVAKPRTEVEGCLIERSPSPRLNRETTFAKDVAPILQKRCQECHRPGEVGPFTLLTYDDIKKRSKRVREAILEERMPPWHADPQHGSFLNDRRLTQEERDILLTWIDQGAPKGDDKDLPAPIKAVEGWTIGQPDKVFAMDEEFSVPATGVLDYKKFVVDPGFKEDMWVERAECRPGNRQVVHHVIVYILTPGKRIYEWDGATSLIVGWAPGDMPFHAPPGTARKIPAGSKFVFEMHYTPNGTAQTDRSSIGVIFAKKPPEREVETNILANMIIRIPPGSPGHRSKFFYVFRDDAKVYSFMPHMHVRGLSARYELTYPDGKTETLLSVPDYDFNWQAIYRFQKPLEIPKGSKLCWTAQWDNSADNPRNPDPSKEIRWGIQTWDEMQNGWMEVVWKNPKK